jgi:hypothetical protein
MSGERRSTDKRMMSPHWITASGGQQPSRGSRGQYRGRGCMGTDQPSRMIVVTEPPPTCLGSELKIKELRPEGLRRRSYEVTCAKNR